MSDTISLRNQVMNVEREITVRIAAGCDAATANGVPDFDEQKFIDWLQWARLDIIMGVDLVDAREQLKGFVIYSLAKGPGNIGQIDLLWCNTDIRGRGFGEVLLTSAIANLSELEMSKARLSVGIRNTHACHLYERTGWEKIATGNGYYVYERKLETLKAG